MSLLQLNRIRSGFWIWGMSNDNISNRDVLCLTGDELWVRADADGVGTMPAAGISMDDATAGNAVRVLMLGTIENSAWAWNPGATLYVSTAPGALTESAPTAPDVIQAVGYAYRSNIIYFSPQGNFDALSLMDYEVQTGIIAEPTTTPKGDGHVVIVLYTMYAPDRVVTWKYANGGWYGTEAL
jgi:hypothetical protein